MLFNSSIFAVFIALLLPLYAILPASRPRKLLLLVASYLFYANWDWRYLSLLLISTAIDYHAGKRLARTDRLGARRGWLFASLFTNLGFLGVFKYGNFFIELAEPIWSSLGIVPIRFPGNIPVGISFYTFQTMSYTIDIYRKKTSPCGCLLDFALYVSFFAQLVAGPIVRSTQFLPQIVSMKQLRMGNVSSGTHRFLLGLFKKVAIADNVGLFVDTIFQAPGGYGAITLWGGAFAFVLQVYCDFSAYSDMAVGIGRAFGIKLPENFKNPYLARSITEFWQRWHISLSTWLRDYLFIPLGGSRKGLSRTYANLFITMFLGGLWHGAALTYVVWGGLHGLILMLERILGIGTSVRDENRGGFFGVVRGIITVSIHAVGLVIFRSADLPTAWQYITRMVTAWESLGGEQMALGWTGALILLCTGQYFIERHGIDRPLWIEMPAAVQGAALAMLLYLTAWFQADKVAFIYFQF